MSLQNGRKMKLILNMSAARRLANVIINAPIIPYAVPCTQGFFPPRPAVLFGDVVSE